MLRISMVVLSLSLFAACGGEATMTAPAARTTTVSRSQPTRVVAAPRRAPRIGMQTQGLMGSLSNSEASGALEPHLQGFAECFEPHTRRLRTLGGRIALHFKVGVDGRVRKVHPVESTVGHRDVERCVVEVAESVRFPRPRGGEAELTWPFELDPAEDVRLPVTWDPSRVERVVTRRGPQLLETCRPDDSDDSYQITVYVASGGRVLSSGAVAGKPDADEELDCVSAAVRSWHMPPAGGRQAKVTFELR